MPTPGARQTLLDDHFNVPLRRRRHASFLHLPRAVRERIYNDACREERPEAFGRTRIFIKGYQTGEMQTAASLMLTCHKIHDEVFQLVYSRNMIYINGTTLAGLNVLRKLGPRNVASLRQLAVHLAIDRTATQSLCLFEGCGQESCGKCSQSKNRLSRELPTFRYSNLQRWHDTLNEILPHLPKSDLHVHLLCDMQSVDIAKARNIARRLFLPLQGRLTLAGCSVHLGQSPNVKLRELAEEVALRAAGQPGLVQQRLSFLDLPPEIRAQILSYTDLVTPSREVEWRPGRGYWTSGQGWCDVYSTDIEYPHLFCRRAHAAFSSRCPCWLTPQPTFLICRTLRLEAERVFFQQNRIVIKPAVGINRLADHTPAVLDASHYLQKVIPTHALQHLRVLEIVFSPLKGAYLQEHEHAYQDWLSTLDFIKDKLVYQKLILRIAFSAWAPNHASHGPLYDPEPPRENSADIFKSYKRTLFPLSILRAHGLAHLQLDLALPSWLHTGVGELTNDERKRLSATSTEREIETWVMGESYAPTVPRLTDSLWKLVWLDMVFADGCKFAYDDPDMSTAGL